MTTITDTFFAPERDMEVRNTARKATWNSLFVSSCVHVLGFALVIVLSQYSLEKRREQVSKEVNAQPINAVLYIPRKTAAPLDTKVQEKEASSMPKPLKVDDKDVPTPVVKEPTQSNLFEEKQESVTKPKTNAEPQTIAPTTPLPETSSSNANQRAGQFNFSVKEAASQYFDAYNNDQLAQEAVDAAREYQHNKTHPTIVDPRKDNDEQAIPPRPVKRVDCTSSAAKTLAVLSGITGGTLQCTNLGDPNRFIDARIKKRSNEGR
jgi:hypothetical protein